MCLFMHESVCMFIMYVFVFVWLCMHSRSEMHCENHCCNLCHHDVDMLVEME